MNRRTFFITNVITVQCTYTCICTVNGTMSGIDICVVLGNSKATKYCSMCVYYHIQVCVQCVLYVHFDI